MDGTRAFALLTLLALLGCEDDPASPQDAPDDVGVPVALLDLDGRTYLGFEGGLYAGGSDEPPGDHLAAGLERAGRIRPLDGAGVPDPAGHYVLLSIGMSNTTQEFCAGAAVTMDCEPWTFMGQAARDPAVDREHLIIANGAMGGQSAEHWDAPDERNYDRVLDQILAPLGLTEAQVQVVWMKVAQPRPVASLPAEDADARILHERMGAILRALRQRYPNLQLVFASSRIYAGFATTTLNPEPYAFESGLAVKWLIEEQIRQMRGELAPGGAEAGDLRYDGVAPWVGWGPYMWAGGPDDPRSDGLFWVEADFQADGTHPSRSGEEKVGGLLLDFFKSAPVARCWFVAGLSC